MKIPELLSPAGTREAFLAAIIQGCDAIYLGGKDFGARAYATNFTWEELSELISLAHLHRVRVYYTLNTLVKDIEFQKLDETLKELSFLHLDGLIIQDFGVYYYILQNFPDFILHCSTQMNLHHVNDVELCKVLGFERVVLARECSISDINFIKENVDIELETFVHGALCYCYSGLCLMSSIYGERSGNRGKCAQPCRLSYTVDQENAYFLSPKDQMTLNQLPLLIESGIDSFKIEGRMKSPEYVGFATYLYRKYITLYLNTKTSDKKYRVEAEDIENLNQLYNRGHFTSGYYTQHNDQGMISYDHSKHQGIKVGYLKVNKAFEFVFETDIAEDDLLEIHLLQPQSDNQPWPEVFIGEDIKKGNYKINDLFNKDHHRIAKQQFVKDKNYPVYRIRKQALNDELAERINLLPRIPIKIRLEARIGSPLIISIIEIDGTVVLSEQLKFTGENVQKSNNRPMVAIDFEKQLLKTKDTPFDIEEVIYEIDDSIFIPIKDVNQLRRICLERLAAWIINDFIQSQSYQKRTVRFLSQQSSLLFANSSNPVCSRTITQYSTHILISTLVQVEQLFSLIKNKIHANDPRKLPIERIYIEILDLSDKELHDMIEICIKSKELIGCELFVCFPHVYFQEYANKFDIRINSIIGLYGDHINGFLVRTVGQIYEGVRKQRTLALDAQLNLFNKYSVDLFSQIPYIDTIMLSHEINGSGIRSIVKNTQAKVELPVYQRIPLMESANCIYKTRFNQCSYDVNGHRLTIKDRKDIEQIVKCHCQMCYNTIYNEKPLYLLDQWESSRSVNTIMRLDFTVESAEETHQILNDWSKLIQGYELTFNEQRFTRGHYKRGVK